MTLNEKISEMMHEAPAIPRLHIQKYGWSNESLHGIVKPGNVTVYPQVIGLGATFDAPAVHEMAVQISDEERARWNYVAKNGDQGWAQGLDSWAPNINIFRDPRWGRGQETYGEDPFLTGMMAINYIIGLQGTDPMHLKTIATPKHYAVHDGPDPLRHQFNAVVSKREAWITYLPAFQDAITEGNAWSIMGAYSAFLGIPDCANPYLLQTVLRDRWGFKGYVTSDCGAINDIYSGHHYATSLAQAAALAVKAGCDLECGDAYQALHQAIDEKLLTENDINRDVSRLMEARIRLGMFDQHTPYDNIPISVVNSRSHRALARRLAAESIVLLKNQNNLLPLSRNLKSIAVIGPNADDRNVILGNYNGMNQKIITPLHGILDAVGPYTKVTYVKGCGIEGTSSLAPIPAANIHVQGMYYANQDFQGEPAFTKNESNINYDWGDNSPATGFPQTHFSVIWKGTLSPTISGLYTIGTTSDDGMRVFINDKEIINDWSDHAAQSSSTTLNMVANQTYSIRVEYYQSSGEAVAKVTWATPLSKPFGGALEAARKSDVIVAVMGISGAQENEEHDRSDIALPAVQMQLLQKLYALHKPIVLVYINGGPISDPWSKAHIPAIVEAWYPGEEGGHALADVLFGKISPSGRLPVTVVRKMADLPDFKDYHMQHRTYQFDAPDVLYPFGYGLSYASFRYSGLKMVHSLQTGHDLNMSVTVKNVGKVAADEVVEAYIHHDKPSLPMPDMELKAFKRVHLSAGQSQVVQMTIPARELAVVHANTSFWDEPEPIAISIGGCLPNKGMTLSKTLKATVHLVGHQHQVFWPKAKG